MINALLKTLFHHSEEAKTSPQTKSFLEGMETGSHSLLQYHPQTKCKIHWEYHGLAVPINNCNTCWQMYYERGKRL